MLINLRLDYGDKSIGERIGVLSNYLVKAMVQRKKLSFQHIALSPLDSLTRKGKRGQTSLTWVKPEGAALPQSNK